MVPKLKFGDYTISRLIAGGNPISGFSHISPKVDKEMVDYHTTENVKIFFDECLKNGVNTFQARGDRHIMRILNEYGNEGGKIQWIAQIASELKDLKANLREIKEKGAIAIYHHGTYADNLWHTGNLGIEKVKDNMKMIRDTGLLTGLGTHRPEVVDFVEENNWDLDFYMLSFYNLAKQVKHAQATDEFKKEVFDENDCLEMIKRIKSTRKQCLVFKVLGAGRKTKTKKDLENVFEYAYSNIKEDDAVVVGMFQKYKNQVREDSEIVGRILC